MEKVAESKWDWNGKKLIKPRFSFKKLKRQKMSFVFVVVIQNLKEIILYIVEFPLS